MFSIRMIIASGKNRVRTAIDAGSTFDYRKRIKTGKQHVKDKNVEDFKGLKYVPISLFGKSYQ